MKATIKELADNGKNYGHKKELIQTFNVITDTLKEIITVRCYMGRSASAAIGDAIKSAGIELSKDIHGVGDGAIHEALSAIAETMIKYISDSVEWFDFAVIGLILWGLS